MCARGSPGMMEYLELTGQPSSKSSPRSRDEPESSVTDVGHAQAGGEPERAAALAARSPGLVPSLAAFSVLLWFAADEGGFKGTTWMPATLLLGAVLVACLALLPRPRPARLALAAILLLAGYGAFCLALHALGGAAGARVGRGQPDSARRRDPRAVRALAAARPLGRIRPRRLRARRRADRPDRAAEGPRVRTCRSSTSTKPASRTRSAIRTRTSGSGCWACSPVPCWRGGEACRPRCAGCSWARRACSPARRSSARAGAG